jgi:hypothetical protein
LTFRTFIACREELRVQEFPNASLRFYKVQREPKDIVCYSSLRSVAMATSMPSSKSSSAGESREQAAAGAQAAALPRMPLCQAIEHWAEETEATLQSLRSQHDRRQQKHQAISEQLDRFVAASGAALAEVSSISAGNDDAHLPKSTLFVFTYNGHGESA